MFARLTDAKGFREMNGMGTSNKVSMKEQNNIIPPALQVYGSETVIKADVNLSRLPFFALTRKGLKNFKTQLIITETRSNEGIEFIWKITANPEYGYPSPFAKKVHRAVEYMLTQNGFPVPDNLDFSFYEISDVLGIKPSGRTCGDIKRALLSIMFAAIESKGAFCYLDNGKKRWVEDYFNLYDRVILVGETLSDGTIADRNRIYFNEWYLKSLNSSYIKPLDFPYWNSFRSDIARRLYEYLSFISFATKCKPFSIEYYRLCQFLPITPQNYFSQACQKMQRAHQELMKTGFLKKVAWRESKTDPKKWIITYYFGLRAKSELQRGFKDDTYRPALLAVETAEISEIEELIEPEEEEQTPLRGFRSKQKPTRKRKQTQEEETPSPIAQELINRGITKSVAIDFAEHFPYEYIKEKIEMHDVNKATGILAQNAAGWLREAITRDFKLSEEQKQKLSRVEKIKVEEEIKAKLEEQAKEIQEQRLKEALANFPSDEQWVRERVVEHVNVREMTIKAVGGEQFTEEEIEQMYLNFQAQVPKTLEEKRGWLISNYSKYSLSAIISELKKEQQQSQQEETKETCLRAYTHRQAADERFPLNSIEQVLGEVARQMAEFEAKQNRSEKEDYEEL